MINNFLYCVQCQVYPTPQNDVYSCPSCKQLWTSEGGIIRAERSAHTGLTANSQIFFDKYHSVINDSVIHHPLWWERINTINTSDLINWCVPFLKPKVIIELGCGDGSNLSACWNSHNSLNHIIGCDVSLNALITSSANLSHILISSHCDITLFHCDASALPLPSGIADIVIMSNVLHHSSTYEPLIECARLLRPGGILIFTDITNGNIARNIMGSLFKIAPRSLRTLFSYDLLVDNQNPDIKLVQLNEARSILMSNGMYTIVEFYRGLFLFILQLFCIIIPFLPKIIPKPLWWALSNIEHQLLIKTSIQPFAALYYSLYIKY